MGKKLIALASVVGLIAIGLAVDAGPVDAGGPADLVVTKVVQGPVPAGTEFVVDVDCDFDGVFDTQLTFPETGGTQTTPSSQGQGTICVVTETDTGGALSTTFACEVTVAASPAASCQGNNTGVFPAGATGNEVTITITNTFPEPEAEPEAATAEPVEAAPTFTG